MSPSSTFRYGGGAADGQGSTVDLFIALNDPTSASNLPAFAGAQSQADTAAIRRILTLSAKRLSPGDRDDNFGSGLIDPLQALQLADPRSATTTPFAPTPATRQR